MHYIYLIRCSLVIFRNKYLGQIFRNFSLFSFSFPPQNANLVNLKPITTILFYKKQKPALLAPVSIISFCPIYFEIFNILTFASPPGVLKITSSPFLCSKRALPNGLSTLILFSAVLASTLLTIR